MPLPELKLEFKSEVENQQEFYMLSSGDFLEKVKEYLDIEVDNKMIEEVKNVSRFHEESNIREEMDSQRKINKAIFDYDKRADHCLHDIEGLRYDLSLLEDSPEINKEERLEIMELIEYYKEDFIFYSGEAEKLRRKDI